MRRNERNPGRTGHVDRNRRRLLGAVGGGAVASILGFGVSEAGNARPGVLLRWGIVGTGGIAAAMAPHIRAADGAMLAAVSSRRMESARKFADEHDAGKAFDDWRELVAHDGVDAIYVATPTSVREEICIAAAENGKHVLGEKPFADLASLKRITSACRGNGVGFMDGTHFVHHPRTGEIRRRARDDIGTPRSLASAFQVGLDDRSNIRYNPQLEPTGAIGDLGWYNMRAAVEYLSSDAEVDEVCAYLRRDEESGAAISGGGIIRFDDGSMSTWVCGFDVGATVMDLRITGSGGVIGLDDFVAGSDEDPASYRWRKYGSGPTAIDRVVEVSAAAPAPQLMFTNFAAMVNDAGYRERSIAASERTQALLDACWKAATATEKIGSV